MYLVTKGKKKTNFFPPKKIKGGKIKFLGFNFQKGGGRPWGIPEGFKKTLEKNSERFLAPFWVSPIPPGPYDPIRKTEGKKEKFGLF